MKQKRPVITSSRDIEDLHHLRLMALLNEFVRKRGYRGTAEVLEIDPQTVTSSAKSGQLTHRVRESLERALQHGVGSAADRQRERSDKLEKRLDKMEDQLKELKENLRSSLKLEARLDKVEGQLKELKGNLRSGLKELRMSLDGARKYYAVQRRLVEGRLLVLDEAVRVRRPDYPQVKMAKAVCTPEIALMEAEERLCRRWLASGCSGTGGRRRQHGSVRAGRLGTLERGTSGAGHHDAMSPYESIYVSFRNLEL